MEYDVLLPPPARRDFRKLPPEVQPRIRRALRSLKNPRSVDAKKLSDSKNRWRIRVRSSPALSLLTHRITSPVLYFRL